MNKNTKKLVLAGILVGVGVVFSPFTIPLGVAKAFPIQHLINLLSGVLLGPFYALGVAFSTSLIRNLMGTGSLFAFPGSMIGAYLCGLFYHKTKKLGAAFLGEILGTGIIGAILSYPIALFIMGNSEAAVFAFVLPFLLSSVLGSVMGMVLLKAIFLRDELTLD